MEENKKIKKGFNKGKIATLILQIATTILLLINAIINTILLLKK